MNTDNRRNGNGRPDWRSRPIPDQSAAPSSTGSGTRPLTNRDDSSIALNGQHCFGWVSLVDELLAVLREEASTSPGIIIIEHRSNSSASNAEALVERLRCIEQRLDVFERRWDVLDQRLNALWERWRPVEQVLDAVVKKIDEIIVPLAEHNRELRSNELDEHFYRPAMKRIIQTLNRTDDELKDRSDSGAFGALRTAREADREELRQLLLHFGVRAAYPRRGDRFAPAIHKVNRQIPTNSQDCVGRIRRTVRPAYFREHDGLLVEPARVDVFIPTGESTRHDPSTVRE